MRVRINTPQVVLAALLAALAIPHHAHALDAYDAVDVRIGARKNTGGVTRNGNTFIDATAPFGMLQVGPDEQQASDTAFKGFHLCNTSGPGVPQGTGCRFLPVAAAAEDSAPDSAAYTLISTKPGVHRATVAYGGSDLTVEIAARPRYALVRLRRSSAGPITIYGRPTNTTSTATTLIGSEQFSENNAATWQSSEQRGGSAFYALRAGTTASSTQTASLTFANVTEVVVAVAISSLSTAGALGNLPATLPAYDTEATAVRQDWVDELGSIAIDPEASDATKTRFYTALYHTCLHPSLHSDSDGRYLGFDGNIKTMPDGRDHYTHFSSWDTYRSHMPLQALLRPRRTSEMAQSLLLDGQHNGNRMPQWVLWNKESSYMSGIPSGLIVAWSWLLGANDFDIDSGFSTVTTGIWTPPSNAQAPSTEIEHGAAYFTFWQLARRLGRSSDVTTFDAKSKRWWSLWNSAGNPAGIYGRDGQGNWGGFSWGGGAGNGTHYEECSWHDVQWGPTFDLHKLIALKGGASSARTQFASYLSNWHKYDDHDGPAQALTLYNQPIHHIPWVAGQIGAMQQQADSIRALIVDDFRITQTPDAMPGNDDLGGTSAWLVWSMLGMYPLYTGTNVIALNTPYVTGTVRFDEKTLAVTRSGSGDYLTGVTVNGVALTRPWVSLSELLADQSNTLAFSVGASASWGSDATPPDWRSTDPAGNAAPTISAIGAQTVAAGDSTAAIEVGIHDLETAAGSLTLSAASSDTAVVPTADIALGGSGARRTVTITGGSAGSATLTLTVSDGVRQSQRAFAVTVTGGVGNTAPTISDIASQSVNEDTATAALAFTVGDVETAAGSLSVSGSSSNTALVPNANIVFGGSGSNRTVTVTPAANQSGSAVITISVSDGSLSASDTFTLTVSAANDVPTISAASASPSPVIGTTASLSTSAADDAGEASLTYTWSTVGTPPASVAFSDNGTNAAKIATATFAAAGAYTLRVTATDGGGLSATRDVSLTVSQTASSIVLTQ